jgi:hypothetical protein
MPRDLAPDSYGCLVHGCVSQIVFASPEDGYLFDPDLYTTSDGGATWHRQTGRPTIVLAKVAPGIVWRFTYTNSGCPGPCGLSLLQQMVGSATWTTVRAPFDGSGTGIVPQIVTTDSARVLIAFYGNIAGGVSSHATFYITANLGRSWTKRSDPCGWTKSNEVDAYDSSATPAGVVVVECLEKGDSSNTAFVTVSHDGAKSFGPRRAVPQSNAFMLAAVGAKTIVLASGGVGGAGPFTYMVETSTNGGVAWRTVVRDREILSVGGYERAESYLGFVNSSFGHWIGYGNRLWTTTDGGEHWTASNV